jgi:hypothetical protein
MIKSDYILFLNAIEQQGNNQYNLLGVYSTLLVNTTPSVMSGLRVALQFYADTPLAEATAIKLELRLNDQYVGELGGPLNVKVPPYNKFHLLLDIPDFDVPEEGTLIALLSINNQQVGDSEIGILLPTTS